MADGKNPLLQLRGVVNANGALKVVNTGGSTTGGPLTLLSSLRGVVDASGQLKVVIVP